MAAQPVKAPAPQAPIRLHDRAADNLAFIRNTMLRASAFTAVPGWGMAAMGVIASAGGVVAAQRLSPDWWIWTWGAVAVLGCVVGVLAMVHKSVRTGQPVWKGAGRSAVFSFCPAILAGMMITEMLYQHQLEVLMPGAWLMLYGAAVCAAGAFSVRIVPLMGVTFMVMGTFAYLGRHAVEPILGPLLGADLFLIVGFGVIHIVFGLIIAWRYGG